MIYSWRERGSGEERKRRTQLALCLLINSLIAFVEVLERERVAFGMNEGCFMVSIENHNRYVLGQKEKLYIWQPF